MNTLYKYISNYHKILLVEVLVEALLQDHPLQLPWEKQPDESEIGLID